LNDGLSSRLKTLAKAQGATLYMVLLAAFQVILHHHTGQDDLLVGSPVLGRSRAEFEGIVGLFTNPVILRANCSGNPTFEAFLSRVRRTVLAALEHQDYPTLLLVERLHPVRDLSRPPLCQVMFVLDKPHQLAEQGAPAFVLGDGGLRMNPGGLELEALPLEHRAATLDLVMLTIETPHSLSISMRYNSDLFDAATIARIAEHFETLLHHVSMQPDSRLNALRDILVGVDRQRLAAVRQQYRGVNRQRLKAARRVAISVSQPGSDGANDYVMSRPPNDRPHLYLNGASSGSKH
jgi:non-ribosomal peptide synthetase component F